MLSLLLGTAALLAATLVAGTQGTTLPYFPIDVSRVLASSLVATWVFRVGLAVLFLFHVGYWWVWLAALFAVGISYYDDVHHYGKHLLAVGGMLFVLLVQGYDSWTFWLGMGLWGSRSVLRWLVVYQWELRLLRPQRRTLNVVHERTQEIMLHGSNDQPITREVFRMTGVMQWVAILCLAAAM